MTDADAVELLVRNELVHSSVRKLLLSDVRTNYPLRQMIRIVKAAYLEGFADGVRSVKSG